MNSTRLSTLLLLACLVPPHCAFGAGAERGVGRARYVEIPQLKQQALSGSTEAARKLASYYSKFPNGSDTHTYWSHIAAENGSAVGQFNYARSLGRANDPLSLIRATFWFERSAAQGSEEAQNELEEMRELDHAPAAIRATDASTQADDASDLKQTRILEAAAIAMHDYQNKLAGQRTDWEYGAYSADIRNYTIGMSEAKDAYVIVFEIKDIPGHGPFIGGRADYFVDKSTLMIFDLREHR